MHTAKIKPEDVSSYVKSILSLEVTVRKDGKKFCCNVPLNLLSRLSSLVPRLNQTKRKVKIGEHPVSVRMVNNHVNISSRSGVGLQEFLGKAI